MNATLQSSSRLANNSYGPVFISHKHRDEALARCVADLIRELGGDGLDVHNSSSYRNQQPTVGDPLSASLGQVLHQTPLVILLYTEPHLNWEWCLWECGVATNPASVRSTRVVVFTTGEAVPKPYSSHVRVNLDIEKRTDDARAERDIKSFVRQFCKGQDFWPEGQEPPETGHSDEQMETIAEAFLAQIRGIDFQTVTEEQRALMDLVRVLEPGNAKLLGEAFDLAHQAVQWGLSSGPHSQLFTEWWDRSVIAFLRTLAKQRIVMRAPRNARLWEQLIDIAMNHDNGEWPDPYIRLVSGEGRADPFAFWVKAMREEGHVDAWHYEEPLRKAASSLYSMAGKCRVERRFLLDTEFFRKHPEAVATFAAIIEWMTRAHIDVSLARRDDVSTNWRDYALLGNVAVSRFESFTSIAERSLVEDFSTEALEQARRVWDSEIVPRWSTRSPDSLSQFLEKSNGLI